VLCQSGSKVITDTASVGGVDFGRHGHDRQLCAMFWITR
jgi:hypothetical protein